MPRIALVCALLVLASRPARAQLVPGEIVAPGNTFATATDADAARINPGAMPLVRHWSARITHVGEWGAQNTALNATALTFSSPLFFGLAGSLGVRWARPEVPVYAPLPGASSERNSGHAVTGEIGLGYAIMRGLGVGLRVRITGASGRGDDFHRLDGAAGLDLGFAWRIAPALAIAIVAPNLLGPQAPLVSVERAVGGGIGFRPSGTDQFTLGVDGIVTQSGRGWVRAGLRIGIPYVGSIRGEAVINMPSREEPAGSWRAGGGLELAWGVARAGGGMWTGGSFGRDVGGARTPWGGYLSGALEPVRESSAIPSPSVVVTIPTESDLGPRSVAHMVLVLERLRRDPSVRGVLFAPRGDVAGLGNAEELRSAFQRLRAAGKRVACHLTDPSGSTYYACAAADEIMMDPVGMLRMAGIRTSRYFLGDALREVGVHTDFVRIGAWKSAAEQFTRHGSSPEALAQENELLDDFYASLIRGVAQRRAQTDDRARASIEAGPYTARQAREAGLIDALGDREMAERSIAHHQDAGNVTLGRFMSVRSPRWAPARSVAVLYIDGDMIEGESFDIPGVGIHLVGDQSIVPVIERLAADPRIAAIVVRIDTPGGSAEAAELMWRALERASHRKPVIASFGRVAASGGYYVASAAREIFANASTLTGSIGIFFGRADVSELLGRLHVGLELNRRGPRADMDSIFRAWNDDERTRAGELIREFYNTFLARVAAGRHMRAAEVHAVAEGRVFAGRRALRERLVDRIGGLAEAVDRAREIVGLPADCDVLEYPAQQDPLFALLGRILANGPAEPPTARLLRQTEIGHVLSWLFTVAWAGHGRALALTEWPLGMP